jgi:hypothetical protein
MAGIGPSGRACAWSRTTRADGRDSRMRVHVRFKPSGVSHATLTRVLVVRLCAAFGIGNAITKACPPDLVRLDNAAACLFAANAARKTYAVVEFSFYLSGCFWHAFTDRVYYNIYSGVTTYYSNYSGNIQDETHAQPLCAGAAGHAHARLVHAATQSAPALKRSPARADASVGTHTQTPPDAFTSKQTLARTHTNTRARTHAQPHAQPQTPAHTSTAGWHCGSHARALMRQVRRRPRRPCRRSAHRTVPAAYAAYAACVRHGLEHTDCVLAGVHARRRAHSEPSGALRVCMHCGA